MSNVPIVVPSVVEPPTEEATAIHPVELLYHIKVCAGVQGSQALEQQIQQMQAQIEQFQANIASTQIVTNSWMGHLTERYHLNPGDYVTDAGQIVRVPPPPEE